MNRVFREQSCECCVCAASRCCASAAAPQLDSRRRRYCLGSVMFSRQRRFTHRPAPTSISLEESLSAADIVYSSLTLHPAAAKQINGATPLRRCASILRLPPNSHDKNITSASQSTLAGGKIHSNAMVTVSAKHLLPLDPVTRRYATQPETNARRQV